MALRFTPATRKPRGLRRWDADKRKQLAQVRPQDERAAEEEWKRRAPRLAANLLHAEPSDATH